MLCPAAGGSVGDVVVRSDLPGWRPEEEFCVCTPQKMKMNRNDTDTRYNRGERLLDDETPRTCIRATYLTKTWSL